MKNSEIFTGKVVDVTYFDTSKVGNPRYTLTIQNDNGDVTTLYTQVNSSIGYTATNYYNKNITYQSRYIRNKLCIVSIELVK